MPDTAAGTQLTALGPVGEALSVADEDRLTAFYTYPDDLRRCWVRANMIASLDGGATADGKTGAMGGPGDRALFALLRASADVILVGAATVRIENYSGAQLTVAQRQARQRDGQAEVPPIAVVTRSGDLDPDARLFTRTEVPPLIVTCATNAAAVRRRLGTAAEVLDGSGADPDSVDPAVMLRQLADRQLLRVLTEGGPAVLSQLLEHELLDELCLTVAPILLGGTAPRIVSGTEQVHLRMRRTHVLTDDDGYLYTRYVKGT
ncbi:pyrimidine reductase family protein [Mycolicibacterium thermoresistibile]